MGSLYLAPCLVFPPTSPSEGRTFNYTETVIPADRWQTGQFPVTGRPTDSLPMICLLNSSQRDNVTEQDLLDSLVKADVPLNQHL